MTRVKITGKTMTGKEKTMTFTVLKDSNIMTLLNYTGTSYYYNKSRKCLECNQNSWSGRNKATLKNCVIESL